MSKELIYAINIKHLEDTIEKTNKALELEGDELITQEDILAHFDEWWTNYGIPCPICYKSIFLYPESIHQGDEVLIYVHVLTKPIEEEEYEDIKVFTLEIPEEEQGGQIVH